MSSFHIEHDYEKILGRWHWSYHDSNGETVMRSPENRNYDSPERARKGIHHVKDVLHQPGTRTVGAIVDLTE